MFGWALPSLVTSHRNHGCEVVKVEFLMQRFKKIGHFLTVTKDGNLQFWSESFSLISSFKVSGAHMWSTEGVVRESLPSHSGSGWFLLRVCGLGSLHLQLHSWL